MIVMRPLVGDRFMEIMKNASQQVKDKSDLAIGRNALIASPADMDGSIKRAMAFLAKHGLKAERVNVAEHMPSLNSLDRISPEQATAIREGMKHSAFWKITPNGTAVVKRWKNLFLPSVTNGRILMIRMILIIRKRWS